MGYRGKTVEQERAKELRADAWTLREIAAELGVATSSVSLWVRDVQFEPRPRRGARRRGPNALQRRKAAEIADLREEGRRRLAGLTDRELLVAGTALYAGEGDKRGGMVSFVNSDPRMIVFFLGWLRLFFEIDESRLRARLYLHEGLDLDGALGFWSELTGILPASFGDAVSGRRRWFDPTNETRDGVSHASLQLHQDPPCRDGLGLRAARFRPVLPG